MNRDRERQALIGQKARRKNGKQQVEIRRKDDWWALKMGSLKVMSSEN
jgi:hypothetical protein